MTNFTLPTIDYTTIGQSESNWFNVAVVGFWSTPITIQVSRQRNGTWECEVTHSSGGYIGSNMLDAEANFAEAILASIKLARKIEKNSDALEANYQEQAKKNQEKYEAEQAKQEANLAADPEMGLEAAKNLIKSLKANGTGATLTVYRRGSDVKWVVYYITNTGRIAYKSWGNEVKVSSADAIVTLAVMSRRSYVTTA